MADFKGTIGTVPEELRGSLSSDLSLSGKLSSLGIPGNGIASIEKTSTDGLTDTYTITYDDGATTTYQITNGNGIVSAVFNDDNTLTLSFGDGTELTTGVLRGDDGEKVLLKAENNVVSYKYESDPNWTTLVDLTGFADDASNAADRATTKAEEARQSAIRAENSATQAQEYYDGIDEVAVQAMEDYLDAHPAVQSVNGKTRHVVLNAEDVGALPDDTFIPSKITDLTNDSDFATNGDLAELQTKLNTLADSDDQTLDQLSEIVAYIKNNKNLIDGITTGKVSVSDIVDNLTSTATNKPLSAKQGKVLKDLIDAIVIPTKVSAFTNDAGYLTEHQDISGKQDVISDLATIRSGAALGATALQAETDPTVPAWAKAATKPSYTAAEVGALPGDTYIPIKVSDLANDVGYLTQHQDVSGKANTADLATVATSGNYNDLSNKPTIPTKVSDLTDDSGHYTKPSGGIPASDLADGVVPVEDVQVNGTSIVADGVANIPKAVPGKYGVVKASSDYGVGCDSSWDTLRISSAALSYIKTGEQSYKPIVPGNQHQSVFYGLAKAAGADMKDSSNAVGTYTDEAKTAINKMIGSYSLNSGEAIPTNADLNTYTTPGTYSADSTVIASITNAPTTTETYKLVVESIDDDLIRQTAISKSHVYQRTGDVSTSSWVFTDWVQNITSTDYATQTTGGIAKIGGDGLNIINGKLYVQRATDAEVKDCVNGSKPIVPSTQNAATFYGLAKAAGDTTQSASDNLVGDYTAEAKEAIQEMLDVPSNSDHASRSQHGLVKLSSAFQLNSYDEIVMNSPTSSLIKSGTSPYVGLTPQIQHESVFYGLAKAAGADMASSTNAVGTYTQEAKTAIQAMLGVTVPEAVGSCVEYITDSSVTIVGEPNTRYVCGEVTSIDITPPTVGTIDVVFTSGSTIAILTLPSTVKMPEWWGGVEAGYTYELVITDGVYAGVMAWPQ